jgi:hypothetical protein
MTALLQIPELVCCTAQSQKAKNTAESRGTVEPGLVGLHLKQNSNLDSVLEQYAFRQLTQVGVYHQSIKASQKESEGWEVFGLGPIRTSYVNVAIDTCPLHCALHSNRRLCKSIMMVRADLRHAKPH